MSTRPALLQDRTIEIALGVVASVVGAWLLHDAYEARGKSRSFLAKIALPG